MNELSFDIAVIGGGASGLMAALAAHDASPALKIGVLERLPRVGKKLMATGNGRCNLTNMNASPADYHGDVAFMQSAMSRFPPSAVLERFKSCGVWPLVEDDGRVYPMSAQASSVLDALRLSLSERGVAEICEFEAAALEKIGKGWLIRGKDGREARTRRVILAAGGMTAPSLGGSASGYRLLEALGHRVTPRLPALVQLKTDPAAVRALKGIKYDGQIDILVDGRLTRSETGEVLFTEYGLSGIAVMQLSRVASMALARRNKPAVSVRLHILPFSEDQARSMLEARRASLPNRPLENFLTGLVNKRLGQTLVKLACPLPLAAPASALSGGHIAALASQLAGWELAVTGTQGFEQAQVTAGGVKCDGFDPNTMESLQAPGLYVAGELYDIDGDCGGFNLQWAWASGLVAGEAAARSIDDKH
ncbi:MAG: aminoacetone oxidase family FAD-binding enzyme [Clostridia bacterium]|nr:aminoacetone oxidase family FAD-binding enzyme [Clostridia bacterium]